MDELALLNYKKGCLKIKTAFSFLSNDHVITDYHSFSFQQLPFHFSGY
jgi:hypothetical protein